MFSSWSSFFKKQIEECRKLDVYKGKLHHGLMHAHTHTRTHKIWLTVSVNEQMSVKLEWHPCIWKPGRQRDDIWVSPRMSHIFHALTDKNKIKGCNERCIWAIISSRPFKTLPFKTNPSNKSQSSSKIRGKLTWKTKNLYIRTHYMHQLRIVSSCFFKSLLGNLKRNRSNLWTLIVFWSQEMKLILPQTRRENLPAIVDEKRGQESLVKQKQKHPPISKTVLQHLKWSKTGTFFFGCDSGRLRWLDNEQLFDLYYIIFKG